MGLVRAGELDVPVLIQAQYRPGIELDTAAGIDYKGFSLGGVRISPVAQIICLGAQRATAARTPAPTTPATSAFCFRRESRFTFIR